MLPRERMIAVLNNEKPDYVPWFPKISFATSDYKEGVSLLDYMHDYHVMAECLVESAERFGYDAVGVVTDIANEGQALGSQYERREDAPSILQSYLLESAKEYEKVPYVDPRAVEPTNTIIRALGEAKKQAGDRLYITAWCNGPLNVASQLMPQADLLCGMMEEPETVHKLLEKCLDFSCRLAVALVEEGADAVSFGHAAASCTVISPDFYREFALPYEKRLVECIHKAGGAVITHICGKIHPIAKDIRENGSDVIDCDHMCSLMEMIEKTGRVIRGNLNPALLANGTPQQVYEATCSLLDTVKDFGRFWLGTGCEINLGTPAENIEAMARARTDRGKIV